MKVVHVSSSDRNGGACIAGYRQHRALCEAGVDSEMLVLRKETIDDSVNRFEPSSNLASRARRAVHRMTTSVTRRMWGLNSEFNESRGAYAKSVASSISAADVVNLQHTSGFVDYTEFVANLSPSIPLVITLHDFSAITGGCYYPGTCHRFEAECKECPLLKRHSSFDLAALGASRRNRAYRSRSRKSLRFVADSSWLGTKAKSSSLCSAFDVDVIHYGVDTGIFTPIDRQLARTALGLSHDRLIIGFSAANVANPRKGMAYLLAALKGLRGDPMLLCWGHSYPTELQSFSHIHLGNQSSEQILALAYSAADLCAVPSLEEAFGQTALESLACGTPAVAFNAGGLTDIVIHERTGLVVEVGNTDELRIAIERLASDAALRNQLGQNGRALVEREYSFARNANEYLRVYQELIQHG